MKKYILITIFTIILNTSAYSDHKTEEQYFNGISNSAPGSDNYQKLETELVENKLSQYVQKQLDNRDKTGLVNYLLYENGKIVINKKNYNDAIRKNKNTLLSNSVGKSMISYVVGHASCKYGINLNTKMNDWVAISDTLYADNTLLQTLNMTAGDHKFVGERNFKGDGFVYGKKMNRINTKTVAWTMTRFFRGSKKEKENSPYNYSAMSTQVAINYVINKVGIENYKKLLKEIFTDHVGVKDTVHFMKVSWSPKDIIKGSQRYSFFATSEDYLRIAKTIMNDYHSDSCIGDYLRSIYDNRVKKKLKDPRRTNYHSAAATYEYGGQIHFSYKGMKKRVIFAMDGYAGQQVIIDMDNKRILIVNGIDQHYNWNKIVYKVIKN